MAGGMGDGDVGQLVPAVLLRYTACWDGRGQRQVGVVGVVAWVFVWQCLFSHSLYLKQ